MVLSLPSGSSFVKRNSLQIQIRAVPFFQLQPRFVALLRRHLRMLIDYLLEVIHQTSIWNKIQRSLKVGNFIFLCLMFEEQLIPRCRKKFHGHGVSLCSFHGRQMHGKQIDVLFRHVGSKGMSRFVGQHIHISCRTVKIGKDKRTAIARYITAVTPGRFPRFGYHIEELPFKHHFDKIRSLRGHFRIHPASCLHDFLRRPLRNRIAIRKTEGIIVDFQMIYTDTLCLCFLDFTDNRNEIPNHLITEVRNSFRCIAVSLAAHIAKLHEIFHAKAVCLLGTVFHQFIKNFVQFFLMIVKKLPVSFIRFLPDLTVLALHKQAHLGKIILSALKFNLRSCKQRLILSLQRALLLKKPGNFR